MLKFSETKIALNLLEDNIFNPQEECEFNQICTDSRKAKKNDLFIAIDGENFDGHDFIESSISKGATCIIFDFLKIKKVEKFIDECKNCIFISVKNFKPVIAYGLLANFYRKNYLKNVKIIAITGSVGKTTLKNLIHHCLSSAGLKTYHSYGNFNNFLGVPFNIFQIQKDTEYAILEIGMNTWGEIAHLSKISEPDFAIIGNISASHIGNFVNEENIYNKSIEELYSEALLEISNEKSEIFCGLKKNGFAIFSKDLDFFEHIIEKAKQKTKNIIMFSEVDENVNVFMKKYEMNSNKNTADISIAFNKNENLEFETTLPSSSISLMKNSLCACALAYAMNLKNDELIKYLLAFRNFDINANLKGRGEIKKIKDLMIIDETYNAGFDAMISAIENLKKFHFEGIKRKIIILGEMREQGIFSNFLHLKLLEPLTNESSTDIDLIILIGADMKILYDKLKAKNISAFHFNDIEELCLNALKIFKANDLFLIKASNGTSAWKLIEYLENFY